MALFELTSERMAPLSVTTFATAKVRERADLQRLLRDQIEAVVPDGMVIAEEFSNWDDSRRSIDLLVLDRNAKLVVLELKRTEDGGHMELQALRYAAMVSAMTFEQAVDAHGRYLTKQGLSEDPQGRILSFLGWDEPDEESFNQDVRIVLVSADFSKEIMTTVLWLNERELDIRCVRMVPYTYGDRTLLDVQQVIPLPEAEEYQIRIREKASQERTARNEQSSRADRNLRFWTSLLQKAHAASALHRNVPPSNKNWVAAQTYGIYWSYASAFGEGRVELYITRPSKEENKAIYDYLHERKAAIERVFGEPLDWQRLDQKVSCRITHYVSGGSVDDESTWEKLQTAMVESMCRLEKACAGHIEQYRKGAS